MNICRFVPIQPPKDTITTLNFVCERDEFVYKGPFIYSFYRICLVTEGECTVKFNRTSFTVKENDVFILFPEVEYTLEYCGSINLLYISFIGLRTEEIFSRMGISKNKCYFENMSHIRPFWEQEFVCENEFLDIVSESVVLYTLSEIGQRRAIQKKADEKTKPTDTMLFVKKYIDENFTNPCLSLEFISDKFKYNKKYLSHHFKKVFGFGITEYLYLLRINYACTLIEDNHSSVQDISFKCGYKDPLYFSRVFKNQTGHSPKEMIRLKKNLQGEFDSIFYKKTDTNKSETEKEDTE